MAAKKPLTTPPVKNAVIGGSALSDIPGIKNHRESEIATSLGVLSDARRASLPRHAAFPAARKTLDLSIGAYVPGKK